MPVNGPVYCECGEMAIGGVDTADGFKFYCADHLAKSKAKINADIVRDMAKIEAVDLLVSVAYALRDNREIQDLANRAKYELIELKRRAVESRK